MTIFILVLLALLFTVHVRSESESPYNVSLQLQTEPLNANDTLLCPGGANAGLTNTSILLHFRLIDPSISEWMFLAELSPQQPAMTESMIVLDSSTVGFQLRWLQLEHGGGKCNCWSIESLMLRGQGDFRFRLNKAHLCYKTGTNKFCGAPARDARGGITRQLFFNETVGGCPGDSDETLLSPGELSAVGDECANDFPQIVISYQLILDVNQGSDCRGIEGIDENIEFAVRSNLYRNNHWIPLRLVSFLRSGSQTTASNHTVRGYEVLIYSSSESSVVQKVVICGDLVNTSDVQFRWMGTSRLESGDPFSNDMWALASVNITLVTEDEENITLVQESFGGDTLNSSVWMEPRRGSLNCEACQDTLPCTNHYLTFGAYSCNSSSMIKRVTRIGLTKWISLEGLGGINITSTDTTMTNETSPTYTSIVPTPTCPSSTTIVHSISSDRLTTESIEPSLPRSLIESIQEQEPQEVLYLLENLTSAESVEPIVVLFLLGDILDRFNSTDVANPQDFVEGFLGIGDDLTFTASENSLGEDAQTVSGGSLLHVLDRLAFEVFPDTGNLTTENIILQATRLSTNGTDHITTIDSTDFVSSAQRPEMSLQVPPELVRMFRENADSEVRAVSFLFFNVSDLFPTNALQSKNSLYASRPRFLQEFSTLASGIVSTALQCESKTRCHTDNVTLKTPVLVAIHHTKAVEEVLNTNENITTECVFWEFETIEGVEESLLRSGQWSDRGCDKNESLSNNSVTVCECNHLTHFAILLSAAPLNVSDHVKISLEIIGYVGVSISLVAMAITIVTFIILKPLRNMRNFIHINLCISLGIAQIIFVAGIDRTRPDDVPTHCQAIAVLLHYFFLVSFMWMLMEGVVLYIILVRVFVSNTKRYMLAFTIASYGLPLLYMGLLSLPLGFALPIQPNYGYGEACFLNRSTHFLWAFIAPVLVIILINIGFFIMAAIVMWQHKKKKDGQMTRKSIKNWLKVLFTLVVVMGLTWIFGVLIVEVEALLPLAYIYTILVAFQGFWIFLIFVAFPEQVRNEYHKAWKAKVKESEMLSKYFGKDTISTGILDVSMLKVGQSDTLENDKKTSSHSTET